MARLAKRYTTHRGHETQLPVFDLSARLIYFYDLMEENNSISEQKYISQNFAKQKQQLYEKAHMGIVRAGHNQLGSILRSESTFSAALDFLEQAAEHERKKEQLILDEFKKKLLPIWQATPPKALTMPLQDIMNFTITSATSKADIDKFYLNLTKAINLVRTDSEMYNKRLEQIIAQNNTTYADLAARQVEYRIQQDMQGLLTAILGAGARDSTDSTKKTVVNRKTANLAKLIREAVINYANSTNLWTIPDLTTKDILGFLLAIITDLEMMIQKEFFENQDLTDIIDEAAVNNAIDKYFNTQNENLTFIQRKLTEGAEAIKAAARPFINTLLVEHGDNDDVIKNRRKIIERNQRNNNHARLDLKRQIKKHGASQKFFEEASLFTIIPKTDQSHGKVNEVIRSALENSITFKTQSGADRIIIPLGHLNATVDSKAIETLIDQSLDQLRTSIDNYYTQVNKERIDRAQDNGQLFITMNKELQQTIDKTNEQLKLLDNIPENIFVYHESVKLYATLEEGKTTGDFHGRDRNALNVLNELYAADIGGNLHLINQELLYNIILNLAGQVGGVQSAVAGYDGTLRTPVENYLSIFAGLLMFDDIFNVAQEVIQGFQQTSQSTIKQIHLYSINDQYIPGSLLLTNIVYNLRKALGTILSSEKAAKVTIDNTAAGATISQYLNNRANGTPYEFSQWDDIADEIAGETKIRITFFTSFLNFLNDLAKI